MTLVKTSVLSLIATVIKMLSALVINKAVAIFIGPSGLALIGQFQNFSQLVLTLAQGAINTGVTKYTAEYGKESERLPLLFSTAGKISLVSSLVVGFGIIVTSKFVSLHFLKTENYSYVFIIFGFTIVLFVINGLLLSILNGLKEIRTWVSINIIQSIYSLFFTTILIVWLGLHGALIALVTNQSVVLLIVLWKLRKHSHIKLKNFSLAFNKPEAKKLMGYATMAITSALTVPISHLIVRNYIGENLGWEQAGYWQAIWYISSMYLMVVTITLSTYYLPKLSELTDKTEIRKELFLGYKVIMPIVILVAGGIFAFKDLIVSILFTEEFMPMRELFMWQLIGDVIKLASFLLGYIVVAKALVKVYIITEIFFSISFVILSIVYVSQFGLIGITYSFSLNYFVYFLVMLAVTRKELY